MVPAVFVALPGLPMTPTGKIDRRALPDPDPQSSAASSAPVAARDDTEDTLVKIWQDLLRVRSVGVKDNFFELGGHSLLAVHLFTRINQEFGVNLPLATLFQEATIEHLASVIHSQSAPKLWSSLVEIEPKGDHLPFFCVHGITGDILWFRELARCLAPDYPFYGLQARGLDGVQQPLAEIEAMAAHYIAEIRRLQPQGPYLLGGASLGGTVALEIAQQLLRQGEEVSLLAIFDHSPANISAEAAQGVWKKRLLIASRALKNFPLWFKEFVQMGPSRMLLRIRRFLRLARKVKGRPQVRNLENLEAADLIDFATELPAHRRELIVSHFQAMRTYDPQPYPAQVTLFRAMSRPLLNTTDPELAWRKLAPGRVKVLDIPSSHEGMFKEPHVRHLAESLRACIDQASSPQEAP
jgi:thioesterase domain-containing protein/acyl carrier protein